MRLKLTKRMKNFSYLIVLLFSITLASCGDMNEFTPKVVNPDADWKITFTNSFMTYFTTNTAKPQEFTPSINESNGSFSIFHRVHNDARAELKPMVTITDNGTVIDIVYTESSPALISGAYTPGATEFTHNFTYAQKGRGTGGKIMVRVRFDYPKPQLGSNTQDLPRYITF